MQDKFKQLISYGLSMAIKYEPEKRYRVIKHFLDNKYISKYELSLAGDVKIIFPDDETRVFTSKGDLVIKSFKKKKEA